MRNLIKIPVLLSLVLILLVRCNDKDAYFERPGWLEPPIYQVLQNQGKFTNYLKCVDRTLYASILKTGGLYTVFAPNDEAFAKYLVSKNLASVSDIPDSLVTKIVSYSIVYNNYSFAHLTDVLNRGWDSLASTKKKTTYYESIHQEKILGKTAWAFDMPIYSLNLQNNKYIPFYLSPVFENGRSASQAKVDFEMFYNTPYTGRNVQSASILTQDMYAENGVAHEVDQVLEPLPTLEKLLDNPDYSEFKRIINQTDITGNPYFISYTFSKDATSYFNLAFPTKNINEVFTKYYSGLSVWINVERTFTSAADENGGSTIFAPNNAAVTKFYTDKLAIFYPGGIQNVPPQILLYFINAQMTNDLVWPDTYKGSLNAWGESFNGKGNLGADFNKADYPTVAPASNGLFYGSNNYIKSSYFETVFSEIFLNPNYSYLNNAFNAYFSLTLQQELRKCELNGNLQENYTVLLPTTEQLQSDGFNWVWLSGSTFGFTNTNSLIGTFDAPTRMQRLVRSHIFKRLKNQQVNCALTNFITDPGFASAYGGYSFAVNDYGDMIRYKNNQIQMVGNFDDNDVVTATPYKTFLNGQVFKIDKMLQYSKRVSLPTVPEGYKSKDLLTYIMDASSKNVFMDKFKNYLILCLKGETTDLAGLSNDVTYTIFVPTNTAMDKAVANGDLPDYALLQSGDAAAKIKASKFIFYHILKGKIFADDGLTYIMPNDLVIKEETWPTALKDVIDETYLAVRKDASGNLIVSSQSLSAGKTYSAKVRTATVTRGTTHSNFFGGKAVIHEINDYLVYKKKIQ
ncbi:MAG TPA: fasciclin domain-containing protein [Paludibacter sp.]